MNLERDSSGSKVGELEAVIAIVCFLLPQCFFYLHEGYYNEEK